MDGTLFAAKQSALKMARIKIKYLGVHVEDDQIGLLIKAMEEILKRFAGLRDPISMETIKDLRHP
ncbi:MAG: hypothetical protein ACLQGU_21485 [bacterium]